MGLLDLLQDPNQTPEQILANEQLQWLMQKGLDATNIQDDAITAALVDPSAPNAPTGLTLTGSGTYQDDKQGLTRAYVTLSWTNPTANFGDAVVLYRQTGQTLWMHATRTTGTTARIEGLECGLNYDFGIQAVSQFNIAGAVASLTTQLMPGDTSGPSAPGTPTIADKKLTTITFQWAASASKDTGGYECEIRTASSGGGSQVWAGKADATFITVDQASIGFGVTRYFRVRGVDYTKNTGSWSSDVSFSFAKIVQGDVSSGAIDTPELATDAVSVYGAASASNEVTISSSTTADMPDMSRTLTLNGGNVKVIFDADAAIQNDDTVTGKVFVNYYLYEDGVEINTKALSQYAVPAGEVVKASLSFNEPRTPAAGSHTYKIRWKINSASLPNTFKVTQRRLWIEELSR